MPDGTTYNVTSTKDPLEVRIQDDEADLYFGVRPLASYDVNLGMKWHEGYNVRQRYRTNAITLRKNGRAISIKVALQLFKTM